MSSKLDFPQILKKVFDEDTKAFKTIPSAESSFAVALDANEDSIATKGLDFSQTVSGVDNTVTANVIDEINVQGAKSINIYSKTLTTITGAKTLTVQISPVEAGDVWVDTALTITPDLTVGNVIVGTVLEIVAKRARVVSNGAITSGTYDLYFIGRG